MVAAIIVCVVFVVAVFGVIFWWFYGRRIRAKKRALPELQRIRAEYGYAWFAMPKHASEPASSSLFVVWIDRDQRTFSWKSVAFRRQPDGQLPLVGAQAEVISNKARGHLPGGNYLDWYQWALQVVSGERRVTLALLLDDFATNLTYGSGNADIGKPLCEQAAGVVRELAG